MTRAQFLGAAAVVAALLGCATPNAPWYVNGLDATDATRRQAADLVEAAKRVTPDKKGWLAQGGMIWLEPDVRGVCYAPPPKAPTGCASPHSIWILFPHPVGGYDLALGTLPHELCHLGLAKGGAFGGPLDMAAEDQADACALLVRKEALTPK